MNKLISKYWLALVALVSVCMFSACSNDDDAVTPVFPQVQTIAGAAGDVKEFTFDANESWSLSSNKIWCKIAQNDAENGFVINGTAESPYINSYFFLGREANSVYGRRLEFLNSFVP